MRSRHFPAGGGVGLVAVMLSTCFPVGAAETGASDEIFPDYDPAHTVIKCPYIPPQLEPAKMATCFGAVPTCVGTGSHDLIIGTELDDVIIGLGGNDTIHNVNGVTTTTKVVTPCIPHPDTFMTRNRTLGFSGQGSHSNSVDSLTPTGLAQISRSGSHSAYR